MSIELVEKSKISFIALIMSLLILFSNPMWFTWNYRFYFILFFSGLLILCLIPRLRKNIDLIYKNIFISIIFFLYFCVFSSVVGGFQSYFLLSFSIVFLWPLIRDKEKKLALSYLTTFLAVIMFFSFIPWFINTFLFGLPSLGTISYYESKGMDVVIKNYGLFIQVEHDFLVRFYSVFDEPGTIGTLLGFVLYGNKYNLKDRRNIVLLIAAIFTFSLAFYIVLFLGLIIQKARSFKQVLLYSLIVFFVSIVVFFFLQDDATFNATVIERVTNVGDSMDSRESSYLVSFYDSFITTSNGIYGVGRDFIVSNGWMFTGQSYKFFILEFGILGAILLFVTYYSFVVKHNLYSYGLLILFLLSFVQRPFALLSWQLLLFIVILSNEKTELIKKNVRNFR